MKTDDLALTTYCQIDAEDFINFCGLLRKPEPYGKRKEVKILISSHTNTLIWMPILKFKY